MKRRRRRRRRRNAGETIETIAWKTFIMSLESSSLASVCLSVQTFFSIHDETKVCLNFFSFAVKKRHIAPLQPIDSRRLTMLGLWKRKTGQKIWQSSVPTEDNVETILTVLTLAKILTIFTPLTILPILTIFTISAMLITLRKRAAKIMDKSL